MKETFKIVSLMTMIIIFIFIFSNTTFAATANLSVEVSPKDVHEGDIFTIYVKFNSDEPIGTINASLTYDDEMIEYQSGGGNVAELSSGTGGISDYGSADSKSMTYLFKFLAKKSGSATFSVSNSEIISYNNGALLGNPKANINIKIDSPKAAEEEPDVTDEFDSNRIEYDLGGELIEVYRVLPTDEIYPEGYEIDVIDFEGEEIMCLKNPVSGITIVYAIDEEHIGDWYVYDSDSKTLQPFVCVDLEVEYLIYPFEEIPSGYEETTVNINDLEIPALKSDEMPEGYYLVYACSEGSKPEYYFYDESEGTMQRARIDESSVNSENDIKVQWIIIGLAAVNVAFIVLAFVLFKWLRNRK